MKTKEFIQRVKKLGYEVDDKGTGMFLYNGNDIIVFVSKEKQYKLETSNFSAVKNPEELFDLCTQYARTPIDEREGEEKEKFYLQKMRSFYDGDYDESRAFLNLDTSIDVFRVTTMSETSIFKTQFTQKEIDKIKEEQHTDLSEFKQIPVDEVENEL